MIMRPHRGLVAVPSSLLALSLVLSGCTSFADTAADEPSAAATTTPAEPDVAEIEWNECNTQIQPLIAAQPGSDRNLNFECGTTEVPISYDEPDGATLPLGPASDFPGLR